MFKIAQKHLNINILKSVLVKYIISGFTAFLAHISILIIFAEIFKVNLLISTSFGFILAIFVNYYLQYNWIFKSNKSYKSTFFVYAIFCLLCFLINGIIFNYLLDNADFHYAISHIICTIFFFTINFLLNKYLVFK